MRLCLLSALAAALATGCADTTKIPSDTGPVGHDSGEGDTESDADTDADTDSDTDADTDSDTDADTDSDTDADTEPVSEDLTGRTYAVNIADATIVDPPGIGSLLGAYLTQQILLGVESATETELEILGALSVEDTTTQDYCLATIDFPTADFSGNPDFAIGPTDLTMAVSGYTLTISQFEVSGTFASDGTYFDDGVVAGSIDTRPLDPLIGGGEGAICDLVGSFGASCSACPGDGEFFCLGLRAEDVYGEEVSGALVPVAGTNCEACEDGPPAPDAVCEG